MRNKAILMASTLAVAGLLTLNSAVFASGVDTNASTGSVDTKTSASIQRKAAPAEKFGPGRMGRFDNRGPKGDFMLGKGPANLDTQLKELVSAGTIDQATADKMLTFLKDKEAARQTEMEKIKAMTEEQRKAYFESQKTQAPGKHDMFSEMVDKGVLTQAQADSITKAIQAKNAAAQQEALKARLNTLVESKTITQDQATKIVAYMQKEQAARQAEMEKIKAMTQEQRDAYFKSLKDQKVDPLAQLVKDGVLTQAQSDSVAKAFHPGHPGRPHGGKDIRSKEIPPKL